MRKLALITLFILSTSPVRADMGPGVGDEGMEPGEQRVEMDLGLSHGAVRFRRGYYRTGLTLVGSAETTWQGGWTTLGLGVSQRMLGGYPVRLVGRMDVELGAGPSSGPSLGLGLLPGAAVEVGKEGHLITSLGAEIPFYLFVQPETGRQQGLLGQLQVSAPWHNVWRVGLGLEVGTVSVVPAVSAAPTARYDLALTIGYWL